MGEAMSGLLADLFSTIDSKKRQLRGLLDDPLWTIQQGIRNFGEDQRKLTGLQAQAYPWTAVGGDPVSNDPAKIAAAQKALADQAAQMGMAATTAPFKFPQDDALQIAQRNGERMLGLPANNTPSDRMRALATVTADDAAARAHQFGNLDYQSMPISEFKGKLIHKSPSYNRVQSSEYRLGAVDGDPVYMRKANHWGDFTTNVKEGDEIMSGLKDMGLSVDDRYGRAGKQLNNWKLSGGITDKNAAAIADLESTYSSLTKGSAEWNDAFSSAWDKLYKLKRPNKSEAGYIPLSTIVGKVPSKTALINEAGPPFEVPFVTLNNGNLRSRFAAFDPARVAEKDLLGYIDPQLLTIMGGAGLLGVGAYGAAKDK